MEITKDTLLGFYNTMVTIRKFEEKASELFAVGKIPGFVHLYIGEEAVATGCARTWKLKILLPVPIADMDT